MQVPALAEADLQSCPVKLSCESVLLEEAEAALSKTVTGTQNAIVIKLVLCSGSQLRAILLEEVEYIRVEVKSVYGLFPWQSWCGTPWPGVQLFCTRESSAHPSFSRGDVCVLFWWTFLLGATLVWWYSGRRCLPAEADSTES
jgi:hypothetical protein